MKKNVLLLINQLDGGGAERVVSRLSLELSGNYNIWLITFNQTAKMYPHGGRHVFIDLPFSVNPATNGFIARFTRLMFLIARLRKFKKKHSIDVAISFLEASNIANLLSKRKERTVISVRSNLSNEFGDEKRLRIFKNLIRVLYNKSYRIVTPSLGIKTDLEKNFSIKPEKAVVIYNFINSNEIIQSGKEPVQDFGGLSALKGPLLINVGRLSNPKGQWFLFPILKKVREHLPEAKLLIIGEGPLKESLIKTAAQNNLKTFDASEGGKVANATEYDVFLLGFKTNPYPYLVRSDLFILSSLYEGFPNVILEAMCCGLPVMSSDCLSGPREILAPATGAQMTNEAEYAEYGVLLPVLEDGRVDLNDRLDTWSAAITGLLKDESRKNNYKSRSMERCREFDKGRIIESWKQLIDNP